jgi:hypothetical protein
MRLAISFANDLFWGQDHLVTALSRENAGLVMTLKKRRQRLAAPRNVPIVRSIITVSNTYTMVGIDILEKISVESRKSNGQQPFSSG